MPSPYKEAGPVACLAYKESGSGRGGGPARGRLGVSILRASDRRRWLRGSEAAARKAAAGRQVVRDPVAHERSKTSF